MTGVPFLCLKLARLAEEHALTDQTLQELSRAIALYITRFDSKRVFRRKLQSLHLPPKTRAAILAFKTDLDLSIYKNRLLNATVSLCAFTRKTEKRYNEVSKANSVYEMDVRFILEHLEKPEKARLVKKFKHIHIHSKEEVDAMVAAISGIIKNLCYKKLSFVTDNSGFIDQTDFVADLQLHAVEIIRQYEVMGLSEEHLPKLAMASIKNRLANMAGSWSRSKRRPVERIVKRTGTRVAWHFSRETLLVKKVLVGEDRTCRRLSSKGTIQLLVTFVSSQEPMWVLITRLYNKKDEAVAARNIFLKQGPTKRRLPLISLAADEVEQFRSTTSALEKEHGPSKTTMLDFLSIPETNPVPVLEYNSFIESLTTTVTPHLPIFAKLVAAPRTDPLFVQWCALRKKDVGVLLPGQLGRMASRYMGVSMETLQNELQATPAHLWSALQRSWINANRKDKEA